jgi:hypothetical protein
VVSDGAGDSYSSIKLPKVSCTLIVETYNQIAVRDGRAVGRSGASKQVDLVKDSNSHVAALDTHRSCDVSHEPEATHRSSEVVRVAQIIRVDQRPWNLCRYLLPRSSLTAVLGVVCGSSSCIPCRWRRYTHLSPGAWSQLAHRHGEG